MIKAIACLIYNFGGISTDDNSRTTIAPLTVHIIHDLVQHFRERSVKTADYCRNYSRGAMH